MAGGFRSFGPGLLRLAAGAIAAGLLAGVYTWDAVYQSTPASTTDVVTTKFDDVALDDTSTFEVNLQTAVYGGVCQWLTITAPGTGIFDAGGQVSLTSYRATFAAQCEVPGPIVCALVPEDDPPAAGAIWALDYSADGAIWSPLASGMATTDGTSQTVIGAFPGGATGRYVRLTLIATNRQYHSGGSLHTLVRISDLRVYGAASAAPTSAPTIAVRGVCENGQVSLWITAEVAGATYYEIHRLSDTEPAPGTRIYSGPAPTALLPFIDAPVEIGKALTYTVHACNASGCGPNAVVVVTPCWADGTDGACGCNAVAVAHTLIEAEGVANVLIEAAAVQSAIVDAGRESC